MGLHRPSRVRLRARGEARPCAEHRAESILSPLKQSSRPCGFLLRHVNVTAQPHSLKGLWRALVVFSQGRGRHSPPFGKTGLRRAQGTVGVESEGPVAGRWAGVALGPWDTPFSSVSQRIALSQETPETPTDAHALAWEGPSSDPTTLHRAQRPRPVRAGAASPARSAASWPRRRRGSPG